MYLGKNGLSTVDSLYLSESGLGVVMTMLYLDGFGIGAGNLVGCDANKIA